MIEKSKIKNIISHLLAGNVDGTTKTLDGWHIDSIIKGLKRDVWIEQGITIYKHAYVLSQRLHIPWNLYLVIFLKESTKKTETKFKNLHDIKKELCAWTPPEIITRSISTTSFPNNIINKPDLFITDELETYFCESYFQEDNEYRRQLISKINRSHLFQLMLRALPYQPLKHSCSDSVSQYAKLLLQETQYTTSRNLLRVILPKPKNTKDLFWSALYHFYLLDDDVKAISLLEEDIQNDENNAASLLFLYLFTCRHTNSISTGIPYLIRAIELEPTWLLPRVQFIKYLLAANKHHEFKDEIMQLSHLKKHLKNSYADIFDCFTTYYVSGNTIENGVVIELLEKIAANM